MKTTLKIFIIIAAILSFSLTPTSSFARDSSGISTDSQPLASLFKCIRITSDTERLTCQDEEIQKLKAASEAKKLVVIDEKSAKNIKRRSFGFSLPKLGLPELSSKSEKTNAVLLPVKSITNSGRSLTVIMENGQIWQSVNSDIGYIPKKGKFEAKISSGAFGSFVMRLSNERVKSKKIRVRRIE